MGPIIFSGSKHLSDIFIFQIVNLFGFRAFVNFIFLSIRQVQSWLLFTSIYWRNTSIFSCTLIISCIIICVDIKIKLVCIWLHCVKITIIFLFWSFVLHLVLFFVTIDLFIISGLFCSGSFRIGGVQGCCCNSGVFIEGIVQFRILV